MQPVLAERHGSSAATDLAIYAEMTLSTHFQAWLADEQLVQLGPL